MGYGVDIGNGCIKVLALRRTLKGWKLIGAGRRRVPRTQADVKGLHAKLVIDALGGRNGKLPAVVGLTGRDINLQLVKQPQMKPLNYQIMMQYEMDQRKGENTDLYADYCTLREPDSYFPQYVAMVGIGKKEYVDGRVDTLERAGLDVRDAVPNSFALFSAYMQSYLPESGTFMLLDIGAESMDMTLVRGGKALFARNVSTGSRAFDQNIMGTAQVGEGDAEVLKIKYATLSGEMKEGSKEEEIRPAIRTAAGQLVGVIQSSINFAKMQVGEQDLKVDRIYLSGGGARIRGLREYLQSAAKIETEILDPFQNIDTSALPEEEEKRIRQLPSDLTVAIGLAQIASTAKDVTAVSIIPDEMKKRRDFFRTWLYMGFAAGIMLVTLIVLTVLGIMRRSAEQGALDEFLAANQVVTERINSLNAAEDELRLVSAKSELLRQYSVAPRGVIDSMAKLRKILPDGVSIKSIAYQDAGGGRRDDFAGDGDLIEWVLIDHPEKGMLIGAVAEENDDDHIRLEGSKDYIDPAAAKKVLRWRAPNTKILLTGEIDKNIKGGWQAVLRMLEKQLTDPSRGVYTDLLDQGIAERPSRIRFEFVISFR